MEKCNETTCTAHSTEYDSNCGFYNDINRCEEIQKGKRLQVCWVHYEHGIPFIESGLFQHNYPKTVTELYELAAKISNDTGRKDLMIVGYNEITI